MTCFYDFTFEWYITLSRACFKCPSTSADCCKQDCIYADGNQRPLISVNRMLPGPAIEVCQNDTVVVNVMNNLKFGELLSIHFHGMTQKNTPYMDGMSSITQCGIESMTSFQYRYKPLASPLCLPQAFV
jgi:L-ascorbate oxidase